MEKYNSWIWKFKWTEILLPFQTLLLWNGRRTCNYLKFQKHENKLINPSKLSVIMRKALYVHRSCSQHQPSTIFPKYSEALKMQSSQRKPKWEAKCTSWIQFPHKYLHCVVLVLLAWNKWEKFPPWVDTWLNAFHLEVLRELVTDVWTQRSVLSGRCGCTDGCAGTQWLQQWMCAGFLLVT